MHILKYEVVVVEGRWNGLFSEAKRPFWLCVPAVGATLCCLTVTLRQVRRAKPEWHSQLAVDTGGLPGGSLGNPGSSLSWIGRMLGSCLEFLT